MAKIDTSKLPKVGNKAPLFSLLNQNEETIALKDFLNNQTVVLYFYPRALTPGCTVQAEGIRDFKKQFAANNVTVLGISPDPVKSLTKFKEKKKLNFDLLSDHEHKIAEKYGVWGLKKFLGREYMGIYRVTFIIGKDGKLKHIMEKVNTKTHHEDVLSWIKDN